MLLSAFVISLFSGTLLFGIYKYAKEQCATEYLWLWIHTKTGIWVGGDSSSCPKVSGCYLESLSGQETGIHTGTRFCRTHCATCHLSLVPL